MQFASNLFDISKRGTLREDNLELREKAEQLALENEILREIAANRDPLLKFEEMTPKFPLQKFISEATRGSTHQNISNQEHTSNDDWSSPDIYQPPQHWHQAMTPSPFNTVLNPNYASPLRKVKKEDQTCASPEYKLRTPSRDSDIIEGSYQYKKKMRREWINEQPVMRFIEDEDDLLNESSFFPLRAKKVTAFTEEEEQKSGLPRPDMTKIADGSPYKMPRSINPYDDELSTH